MKTIRVAALLLMGSARSLVSAQDTVVVRADNPPVWGPSPQLVEELRIGALEGEEWQTFGAISGFVVDGEGTLWVADGAASTIRRFRPDGSHLDDVGRKGDGPGEFDGGYGISLGRLPDGAVVAFDPLRFRNALSVFSAQGKYLGGMPIPLSSAVGGGFKLRTDTAGVIYVSTTQALESGMVRDELVVGARRQAVWLRLAPDGRLLDALLVPSAMRTSSAAKGYLFGAMEGYTARTVSAVSPIGYLVTGRTDRYALERPLRDGRTARIERSWEAVPARAEERAMFERQLDAYRENGGPTPENTARIPAQKPPFWAIQVDDQGRIRVATHQPGFFRAESAEERNQRESIPFFSPPPPAMEWWEPLVTDVIEPSGRSLGTLRFPNHQTRLAATRGDTIWVIERGELDEEYVVRYRIEHP